MDPTYSIEAEQYREKIRGFLAEHLPADWSGLRGLPEDQREDFVANWRTLLSDNHLIAPAWPVEYGGGGLSAIERVVLHEEFAQAGVPTGGPNDGFGIGMIGPTLMVLGTEEQKKTFLPRILSGEDRWCQGYSEPNSGSDLASLGTRAVDDGDGRVGHQRSKDLDLRGPHRKLDLCPVSHEPDRSETPRHFVPALSHGPTWHRSPADYQHCPESRLQRGVLHRSPHTDRQCH